MLDDPRACLAVRARHPRSRVVPHVDGAFGLAVPARLAGAHALVDKACARRARRGDPRRARAPARHAAAAAQAAGPLGGTDRAILAMRLAGTPEREIARTVGLDPRALAARVAAIVSGAAVGALDRAGELHAG